MVQLIPYGNRAMVKDSLYAAPDCVKWQQGEVSDAGGCANIYAGDQLLFKRGSGVRVEIDDGHYILLHVDDIIGIVR